MNEETTGYENPLEADQPLWMWFLFICYIGVMLMIEPFTKLWSRIFKVRG